MGDVQVASGNPNGTRGFWGEIAWPPGLIETKNNNNVASFFDYVLKSYTEVDNRERARARDKKQRRRILLEKQHENFISLVRK